MAVALYDALGRRVKTLVAGEPQRGRQKAGALEQVQFYRITSAASGYTETRQLILVH